MENVIILQGIELQPLRGLSSVQALPDFTQFQVTHMQSSAIFKKSKYGIITLLKNTPNFLLARMKV
jgi:hypothetical protein